MREKLVSKAKEYLGYTEGTNNDTKFGDWYGLPHQPWCAMFVSYCANEVGISQNIIKKFASCTTGFNWFSSQGVATREHITPKIGDIIFFIWNKSNTTPDHVGIVEEVKDGKVHTIEGNRSDKVQRFVYDLDSWQIYGYAQPKYEENSSEDEEVVISTVTYSLIKKGAKGSLVKEAQEKLVAKGYSLPKYGCDGDFGSETESAVKQLQSDAGISVDGEIGNDTWSVLNSDFKKPVSTYPGYLVMKGQQSDNVSKVQNKLISLGYSCGSYGADGIFGVATFNAVKTFQKDNGLSVDGIVGPKTWNKLFN